MPQINPKRERLTAAARRLIHANGYAQTTLAEIAEAAEVPLGNVYYYFKTKDELVEAVITNLQQEFKQLTQELDRMQEPRARIDGFLSMLVLDSERVARHGCSIGSLCTELNKGDGLLGQQANSLLEAQLEWLSRQFKLMGKAEEAGELALQLLVQLQGATVVTHVLKDAKVFTRQIAFAKAWLSEQ